MAQFVFKDSMNSETEVTDRQWLKNLVFSEGDGFWEGATGSSSLYLIDDQFTDRRAKASLALTGREKYGFMIDYRNSGNGARTQTLRFGEHTGETVEADIGGNPDLYYREYFVPKEVAWDAIEYFLQTGERKPDLTWEIAEYPEQEV